jgi:hypothetical protein
MVSIVRKSALALACTIVTAGTGCSSPAGPDRIILDHTHYEAAFDAAVEAIRARGLEPLIMDRRGGIIETDAIQTPSLLEPWAWQGTDRELAMLNTLGNTQRRVRIEFSPSSGQPLVQQRAQTLPEPDLLGLAMEPDLTTLKGPIDARAWVWVERTYTPGRRLGSWTLRETSYERPIVQDAQWEQVPSRITVPDRRDRAAERRFLSEIAHATTGG